MNLLGNEGGGRLVGRVSCEVSNQNSPAERAIDLYNNAMDMAFASDSRYSNLSPSEAANLALLFNCLQASE